MEKTWLLIAIGFIFLSLNIYFGYMNRRKIQATFMILGCLCFLTALCIAAFHIA